LKKNFKHSQTYPKPIKMILFCFFFFSFKNYRIDWLPNSRLKSSNSRPALGPPPLMSYILELWFFLNKKEKKRKKTDVRVQRWHTSAVIEPSNQLNLFHQYLITICSPVSSPNVSTIILNLFKCIELYVERSQDRENQWVKICG
jgi:hypothetical protein